MRNMSIGILLLLAALPATGSSGQARVPQGVSSRPLVDGLGLAVHDFALAVLGVRVIDNCDLTAAGDAAAARKRWEFQFIAAPLPFRMGTGSPLNPIAVF